MFSDLQSFVKHCQEQKQVTVIDALVDPKLELPEIHRRVIAEQGNVLLFRNVAGSNFKVVTNLYGTSERVNWAFGQEPEQFVSTAVRLVHEAVPPTIGKLWSFRSFFQKALKIGIKNQRSAPILERQQKQVDLDALPVITSWPEDGGPFFTLPLVYTEHPNTGIHNLGMYRLQRFDKETTGLHIQIAKGSGFHLHEAEDILPVNVFLGGPPAATLAAISPLPENVPELIFASLALGDKIRMVHPKGSALPILANAEFCLEGYAKKGEYRPEGPFGDHYGYYSLTHDFPVFHCTKVRHRKNAIYPATVVGKPKQEDLYLGDYLQNTLSPLFPLVMPGVKKLWSYGETGFHSLSSAIVQERYKREALVSAFRILGEGQLSLTKFLLLTDDEKLDLQDFPSLLTHILERADFTSDLQVFSHLSQDTLDYTGPSLNEGSKGVLLGVGDPIRELPYDLPSSFVPDIKSASLYQEGVLCVSGLSYQKDPLLAKKVAKEPALEKWPLVVLVDNDEEVASSTSSFLWHTFTRFEPAADIYANHVKSIRFHHSLTPPIIIDARMKPWYPGEVECDAETSALVDRRWDEYFK